MVTKEQKLKAAEKFLNMRLEGDGEVINLEDDMTYASFAVIDDEGIGLVYIAPDGELEYRISRSDFERDAIKVLSHYGSDAGNCDVYSTIITFMFIDNDETKALIRCHHKPPFKEDE